MSYRAFKQMDLASLVYRYIPTSTHVDFTGVNLDMFANAFSHKSASSDVSYERLEFLGDSVNTTILTNYIYHRYGGESEGFLSRLRSHLISGKTYSEVSRQIGLPGWVRLGSKHEHLRLKSDVQEDVYEAFVGALFLTFGFELTQMWVVRSFEEYIDISRVVRGVINPRERLTNYCMSVFHRKPDVHTVCDNGRYVVKVMHPGSKALVAEAAGASAQEAMALACETAMELIMSSGLAPA